MGDDLIFLVGGVLVVVLVLFLMCWQHELTHQEIYKTVGIDSNISFSWNGGLTSPKIDENTVIPVWVKQAQAETEVVGYQVQPAVIGLMLMMLICSLFLGWKIDGLRRN